MDNIAIILIVLTNVFLVLILGVLSFLVYRLFKQQLHQRSSEEDKAGSPYHPAILKRMKELEATSKKRADLFCPNHSEEPGEVSCAICDHLFCKSCIRSFKSLHFCKEHLPLIMRNEWQEVLTVKTSTTDPEEGVRLYEAKKKLFKEDQLPTYIETHYKINVDHDYIETYLVIYAIDRKSVV